MMRDSIAFDTFLARSHQIWDEQWFLLTAGDFVAGRYNTMTVSWGSFGTIWNRPFAQVVVRPTRHTHSFMEQYETFTLCAFAEEHRKALDLLGSRSGRDGDKIAAAGIHPIASRIVAAPSFAEAILIIECRKIYSDDLKPERFIDPSIERNYPMKDYHRFYFGEVVSIEGNSSFRA
jgi:flavin reductase (DIM6/NTAB) family NADH-FMN oxidoreductase RutF